MAKVAGLSPQQTRELLKDTKNLQGLPDAINKSKGARSVKQLEEMLGKKTSGEWRRWLAGEQANMRKYFQKRIREMLDEGTQ
jgi:hypothetical protein